MFTLGKNLQAIRKHLRMSVNEFAESISVTSRAYSSYEHDERKPPYEVFLNLRNVYDVNLNWLICNDGEMFSPASFEDEEDELTKKVEEILKKKGLC